MSAHHRRRLPRMRTSIGKARLVVVACVSMLFTHTDLAQPSVYLTDDMAYGADEVKAVYLYHFGTYVEWPDDVADVIRIALLDADEMSSFLQEFLADRRIGGRPVIARAISSIAEITDEQILFIGASSNSQLEDLLSQLGERPVLVVTDTPEGLHDGAVINLLLIEDRVRFEISLNAARRAGLMLSSRLLSAAIRVQAEDA